MPRLLHKGNGVREDLIAAVIALLYVAARVAGDDTIHTLPLLTVIFTYQTVQGSRNAGWSRAGLVHLPTNSSQSRNIGMWLCVPCIF